MPGRPDASVVVIAYNDAERLPRAVGSVLAQSLSDVEVVIVDDASTDATGRVADGLANDHADRVRSVHLAENSGGCGGPRNAGIEHARGTHVMFLDSDDVLDRHACLNLVATAEETAADLVSGLCSRVYLDRRSRRESPWYPRLYDRRAVYDSVLENPDLLYDTLATNKCYRRDFLADHGLRFAERLHYEDLLFTAQAYLAARRVALIPHRVYTWYVHEKAPSLSISNRRAELANFADRLEVHRRIDALFRGRGTRELELAKGAKFVNHDLILYLRELRARDKDYRERFLELASSYVAELDPQVFEEAQPIPAIAAFMVRERDYAGALAAAEYSRTETPELRTDLVERAGRVYWGARHLGAEAGRRVLDVTDLGIHQLPLGGLQPGNTLTMVELRGRHALLAGHVGNPLGRIPADAELSGVLEFYDRRRRRRAFRIPAEVAHTGERLYWRAMFDPRSRLHPLGFVDPVWDTRLSLTVDGEKVVTRPARDDDSFSGVALPVRPRLTRLAGDHLRSYITEWGHLAFVLDGRSRWTRMAGTVVRRVAATPTGRRLWSRICELERAIQRMITSRKTKVAIYNRLLTRLPVRTGTAVFESQLGKQYSDNPRYIYEELRRSGARLDTTWSYASTRRGFPKDATLVRRGSWAYYLALARAEFWVDNQGFPEGLRKRRATTYLQTWHGSAYKRMGLDHPRLKSDVQAEQDRLRRMVERFDCFLVRSGYDVDTLVKGLGVKAELLPVGYPRNDALITGGDAVELEVLRRDLGLDDGRQVVLYAPTYRTGPDGEPIRNLEPPFDLARFADELGDSLVLLVRPHYLCTVALPPGMRHAVRGVGQVSDLTALMLISDALVTDYSSIMFDYALLDRPMVFFTPDEEEVAHVRGSYFDLARHAPGPIVGTETGLLAALADLESVREEYAGSRRSFVERFGEYDRGTAARAVVDRFFKGGGRRG
jgi:CDP-glycerol glycerophosphotransferase